MGSALLKEVTKGTYSVRTAFVVNTARAIVLRNPSGDIHQDERSAWRAVCAAYANGIETHTTLSPRSLGRLIEDITVCIGWMRDGLL